MNETRARRRIRAAVEAKGWSVIRMEWEPIGGGAEKEGPTGGWYVEARAPSGGMDWVLGYNWREAVEWANRWLADDKTTPLGRNP